MKHSSLTDTIINSFYNVYNELGFGFLEKVYENSLYLDLIKKGVFCIKQKPIKVHFCGVGVGIYFADLVVEEKIVVEIKASSTLCEEHEAQLLNYLKATNMEVGLLLNFGTSPSFRRKIFDNDFKKHIGLS